MKRLSATVLRGAALAALALAVLGLAVLWDCCYGHGIGPRGPLHCYKLSEAWVPSGLLLASILLGGAPFVWRGRLRWLALQVLLGIAGFAVAYFPVVHSWWRYGEAERVPEIELGLFAIIACSLVASFLARLAQKDRERDLRLGESSGPR